MNRQMLVSLVSGNAVSGVLVATPGDLMILRGCMIHDVDAPAPSKADGEIVIEKINVDYIQIVAG
jgi:small nuclear ribonucleoprotein (snRNP)-like protein